MKFLTTFINFCYNYDTTCLCMQLYDLHVGPSRLYHLVEDGCTSEQCSQCPGNSTCIASMNIRSAPKCVCHPGLHGDKCDQCKQPIHYLLIFFTVEYLQNLFLNNIVLGSATVVYCIQNCRLRGSTQTFLASTY